MKKITILLPAYNEAESFIDLKSCMQQVVSDNPDYDWEFLLINDGSKDHTLDRIKQLWIILFCFPDHAVYPVTTEAPGHGRQIVAPVQTFHQCRFWIICNSFIVVF